MTAITEHVEAFAARTVEHATKTYTTAEGRAALRCALMDAAALIDVVSREMAKGRRKSQQLTETTALLKEIADKLEAMRSTIEVPR